jgi:hypothetical protein
VCLNRVGELVGAWRLDSAEDYCRKTHSWVPKFGNPPCGLFVYDAEGNASVQIMTTPPVSIFKPDGPTAAEALEIFDGYIAYFGTYTVDERNICHQVKGALDPSQVGSTQTRPYQIDGDTLIIGDLVTYKRTLTRIG